MTLRSAALPLALACSLALCAACAEAAGAVSRSWSAPIALDQTQSTQSLSAVACPTSSRCTAVDSHGREVTFNPQAPGTPKPAIVDGGEYLIAVACPTSSQCTALDLSRREVTFNPTAPGTPTPVAIGNENGEPFYSVACPSVSQCTAIGNAGREVTFNPTAPGAPAPVAVDSMVSFVRGIACPSVSQCTAVDSTGQEVTFNPTAPGTPTPVAVDYTEELIAVACPTASRCTAVSIAGQEVTFNPTAPATPTPATIDAGGSPRAVACPSSSQCTATDPSGREVTFNPAAPGAPTAQQIGVDLTAVACPSVSQCTAANAYDGTEATFNPAAPAPASAVVDEGAELTAVACPTSSQCTAAALNGGSVTFNPSAPGTPTPTTIDAVGGPLGLACPSASQCTAVDNTGHEVTFDPAATGTPTPVDIDANEILYLGVACPSVHQCTTVDAFGNELTFNPTSPGTPARHPIGTAGHLACPTVSQCTVVDGRGREVTFNPTAPGTPKPATIDPGGRLSAVACPSSSQCTAVDESGRAVTFNPLAPGTPTLVTIDPGGRLSAVACATATQCVAVDPAGRAIEGSPTSLAGFTVEPIAGATALGAIACHSPEQCVTVDAVGTGFKGFAAVPNAPTGLSISVHDGDVAVGWQPPTVSKGEPLTRYVVTVAPAANDRVPNPAAPTITETQSAGTRSTVVQGLFADCHQTYTVSVAGENAAGVGSAAKSAVFRPSGIVVQGQEPPYVAILLDGFISHSPAFAMDPYHPTTDGSPSYCPESSMGTSQKEAAFAMPPSGAFGFFHKWNFGEIELDGTPKSAANESTPRTVGPNASGRETHSFMLDALAGQGAIVLPYSYNGAQVAIHSNADPTFAFAGYEGEEAYPGIGPTIEEDATTLDEEVKSVEAAWPSAEVVLVGHSQGGLIAWKWWLEHRPVRPVLAFSLDSPINGVCPVSLICGGPSSYPAWGGRELYDPVLLALDESEGDPFHFIGTWGDSPALGPLKSYGTGPETLEHQLLFRYSSSLQPNEIRQKCPAGAGAAAGCPAPEPPDHISECPITSNDPSWEQTNGHFVVKYCPGNVAYFNAAFGLRSRP